MAEFGDKVLELLEEKNISQKELANSLNIAQTTLNGYIKNRRQPDFATVKSIAFLLGVSTDYLLDYHEGNNNLSLQELSLISKMRKMSTTQQQLLHSIADCIIKNGNA
ncbi:MAG: helix-turn-helix domain-containing protein [Lachnospiraceae bacterium]|nr:helix-turn-helix domain-containing protein [Lachnospiraceae bacterium]